MFIASSSTIITFDCRSRAAAASSAIGATGAATESDGNGGQRSGGF